MSNIAHLLSDLVFTLIIGSIFLGVRYIAGFEFAILFLLSYMAIRLNELTVKFCR